MSETQRTNQASPAAPSTERVKELIAAYDLGAEHRIPRELAAALRELLATRERLQAATAYVESRCYEEVEHLDGYVTRDMATDAGEPGMEGMPVYSNRVEEHPEWLALLAILKGEQ